MSINRMLSWFPAAWRGRYEAEVRELLEAHPFTWRERRDLLRACADAWVRELWSWAGPVARLCRLAAIRAAVLLAVGWIGLQLVNVIAGLDAARAIASAGGVWISGIAGFRVALAMMLLLFVARPYLDSGAEVDRPSWAQTIVTTLLFIGLAALDNRGGVGRQLPDVIFLALVATMRQARWFVVVDRWPREANQPRRMLGLQ